jgi:hypothetical protein
MGTTLTTAHRRGRNGTSNSQDSENWDCTVLFIQLVTFAISPYGFELHFLKLTVYTVTSLSLSCLQRTGESPVRWRVLFPTDQSKSAWLRHFTAIKVPERYRSVAVSDWGAHLLYQRRLCECELTGVLHSRRVEQNVSWDTYSRSSHSPRLVASKLPQIGCLKWIHVWRLYWSWSSSS